MHNEVLMVVSFCGHAYLTDHDLTKDRLSTLLCTLSHNSPIHFYLGGYGDFDSIAYSCCKQFSRSHPDAKLFWISPYVSTTPEKEYDGVIYPGLENVPHRLAILKRNEWMMASADLVIAYIDHSFGGAYKSFCFALRKKKQICNLAQLTLLSKSL